MWLSIKFFLVIFSPVQFCESSPADQCERQTQLGGSNPRTPRYQAWCRYSSAHLLRGDWSSECAPRANLSPEETGGKTRGSEMYITLNHSLPKHLLKKYDFLLPSISRYIGIPTIPAFLAKLDMNIYMWMDEQEGNSALVLTGSLDTNTDWQTSGALTVKCLSQLLTSSSLLRGQEENSRGFGQGNQEDGRE